MSRGEEGRAGVRPGDAGEGPRRAAGGTDGAEHGSGGGHAEAHATNRTYLAVAAVLAVLTALEVMVFYVPALKAVLVPILLTLMIGKFALVAMFFMHLRYDPSVLTAIFGGALVIAVAIVVSMMALFGQLVT